MVTPSDLPVEETLAFLERALPNAPARILEVGCGNGAVAARLAERRYRVTALDEALEIREALRPGVEWVEASFPFYEPGEPFDVILFTRSLHHIHPLAGAIERADAILRPSGLLLGEEFAVDRVNLAGARWLYDTESLLEAAGLLAPSEMSAPAEENPLMRWRREHEEEPPLHTGKAMLAAVRSAFDLGPAEEAPCLYRYLCDRLEPTERGCRVARWVLAQERRLLWEREVGAVGLRILARKAPEAPAP